MARLARSEVLDPNEVAVTHLYNRTVRKCFLMGDDAVSGKSFDHRKVWIEEYLHQFAAAFGIDLLGFVILSNHFHLILRSRPDAESIFLEKRLAFFCAEYDVVQKVLVACRHDLHCRCCFGLRP